MRHGQSKANVAGLIISHPENGTHSDYALSPTGSQQALSSAQQTHLDDTTIIFSSDFSRALETAEIVRQQLSCAQVQITHSLRERNFGEYEMSDHGNYQLVWNDDIVDATHKNNGVESIEEVTERVTSFINRLEATYMDKNILLVSHGDTLQILQTAFQKVDGSAHRSLPHLETAEIRELQLQP